MRSVAAAFAVLLSLTPTGIAVAEPTKEVCVDAYKTSQKLRHDGALRAARDRLLICARNPCPEVLQADCVGWLREVDALIPSVIIKARLGASTDIFDVRVLMDGVELAPRLEGRAIEVDAGEHVFVFEHPDAPPVVKRLLIVEGERGRVIDVELTSRPLSTTSQDVVASVERRRVSRTVYVLGAVGVGALAVGGIVGSLGVVARGDLAACRPGCAQDEIDAVARKFLIADVAFIVGAAAIGTATVLYLRQPSVRVSAVPTTGGAMVAVGRAF
ncbi:MAG: uncharacterized protein JWP01_3587 [Myxococcales bacterium]|nr:uncharacterized protein [Myxococcales bacterium]